VTTDLSFFVRNSLGGMSVAVVPYDDYGTRTHQLHLTREDSAMWRELIVFWDALPADPRLLREYQALKGALASQENLAGCTGAKRNLVAAVLQTAGLDLGPR
jgi:GrpB-like predicted nucleotidyltransferase (UPF0157 family)